MKTFTSLSLPRAADVNIESIDTAWRGRFALQVVRFRHRRFDGTMSDVRTWELWRRGRVAAILPYDPASDVVVLGEQFRLPAFAAGVDPVLVEVPAGFCGDIESPTETAIRESQEEAGLIPDRLERIGSYLLSPGGSDELCTLFAGRIVAPDSSDRVPYLRGGLVAEQEDIRLRVWPAGSAIEAAVAGEFPNAVTTIALLWLHARRVHLQTIWKR